MAAEMDDLIKKATNGEKSLKDALLGLMNFTSEKNRAFLYFEIPEIMSSATGVDLKEINFKTYESKIQPGLYFAGEVINVDAITGGFNFQNAWTGAYIAAQAIAKP